MLRRLFILIAILSAVSPMLSRAGHFEVSGDGDSHDMIPGDGQCDDGSGVCTFRAALEEANAGGLADSIVFADSVSLIKVLLGTLEITDSVTIVSDGLVRIDGVNLLPYESICRITGNENRVKGLELYRARRYAIEVLGARNSVDSCTILRCGLESTDGGGILLTGPSAIGNTVTYCRIGLTGNGTVVDSNRAGIRITSGATGNVIGQAGRPNFLSGNATWGIEIINSDDNRIVASQIGPDPSEVNGPGNTVGGVRVADGSRRTIVGGPNAGDGNVISYNPGDGIVIEGNGTDSTHVMGNIIGLQPGGNLLGPNFQNGIVVTGGARHTRIGGLSAAERNIISGNMHHGLLIQGIDTRNTIVLNNFIGTDVSGYANRYNGWDEGDGVHITGGASSTVIGGATTSARNIISGNAGYGVCIAGAGTRNNVVAGNHIGAAVDGLSPVSNACGVGILEGASENIVGGVSVGSGNLISGNRSEIFPLGAGVVIFGEGTTANIVSGNVIGLDITASTRMRNESSGILIGGGAQDNRIGGTTDAERNIISGNGTDTVVANLGRGIHVFGAGTSHNTISGNWIGVGYDGEIRLPNRGIGISVIDGATDCFIGGDLPEEGNRICYNRGHGIVVAGESSYGVTVRHNEVFTNDSLGVVIRDGAQMGIEQPTLTGAFAGASIGIVSGVNAPSSGKVDVYLAAPDPSGRGEGRQWVGSGQADVQGNFDIVIQGLSLSDSLTAIATDLLGSSSEFAKNIGVVVASGVDDDVDDNLPATIVLEQNYPNPFNPATVISVTLPCRADVSLAVFSATGQRVRQLVDGPMTAGSHAVMWDGCDDRGRTVASGIYFYRAISGGTSQSKKMLLLR